jgi:hypothetical protein
MKKISLPDDFMDHEPVVLPFRLRGKTNKNSFVPKIENKTLPVRRLG